MPKKRKTKAAPPDSIVAFMQAKDRAACPVCQLPERYRRELAIAREKGYTQPQQIEFLRAHGYKVSVSDLTRHSNRRHEYAEEE